MTLVEQLANYATYHRDRRNIATHFVGIPMIVLSIFTALSRPAFEVAGFTVSPSWAAAVIFSLFYLRLDLRFGLTMASVIALCVAAGASLATFPAWIWVTIWVSLFVVGWVFQLVGHSAFEGRKPAFVDDLVGLLVGPLFIVAETAFALGARLELHAEILRRAGPTRAGPRALAEASPAKPS